jgi:hypothetical protein
MLIVLVFLMISVVATEAEIENVTEAQTVIEMEAMTTEAGHEIVTLTETETGLIIEIVIETEIAAETKSHFAASYSAARAEIEVLTETDTKTKTNLASHRNGNDLDPRLERPTVPKWLSEKEKKKTKSNLMK